MPGLRSLPLPRALYALIALAIVTSCGGRVERSRATDRTPSPPPMSGDSTPVVNGGAEPEAPPEKPDPAPPNAVLRCSFKEGPWLINTPGLGPGNVGVGVEIVARTESTGEVVLYVLTSTLARKYHLASESPCVFESDDGVAPSGYTSPQGNLALGDDGRVWRSASNTLRRSSPLPDLKCAVGSGYVEDDSVAYFVGPLFLDPGGKTGWGLEGPPGMLGRLTLGSDACSVELTKSPWGDLPVRPNTPRDASGRLHVLDAPTPGGIGIFTSSGTFVKAYSGRASPTDPTPFDVTRCAGGVCVLGADASGTSVAYLDDDGNLRAPTLPLIKGLRVSHLAASTSGHVFIGGSTNTSLEAMHEVVIQMAPPPP